MAHNTQSHFTPVGRPNRVSIKPLRLAKQSAFLLGENLENILKQDIDTIDINFLKGLRNQFVLEIDDIINRLKGSGVVNECEDLRKFKLTLQCECYRIIDRINEQRESENLELLSNCTPLGLHSSNAAAGRANELENQSNWKNVTLEYIEKQNRQLHSYLDELDISEASRTPGKSFENSRHNKHNIDQFSNCSNYPSTNPFRPSPGATTFNNNNSYYTNQKLPTTNHGTAYQKTHYNINPISTQSFHPVINPTPTVIFPKPTPPVHSNPFDDHYGFQPNNYPQNITHHIQPTDAAGTFLLKQQLYIQSPNPFDGKEENFKSWSALLKARMHGIPLSPFDELQVLLSNTAGTPKAIVQDYVEASGEQIDEATIDIIWNVLRERYGSNNHSYHYIERRVSSFPPLHSMNQREELGRLLDLCRLIHLKMQDTPELYKYNTNDGMKNLWKKLPERTRLQWRSYGIHSKINSGGSNPTLSVFITFLQKTFSEINDDFFSDISDVAERAKRPVRVLFTDPASIEVPSTESLENENVNIISPETSESSNITLTTTVTNKPNQSILPSCPIHHSSTHTLTNCRKFAEMSFLDRKALIWNNKLCFKCFNMHLAKHCDQIVKCRKCGKSHHDLLHDDGYTTRTTNNVPEGNRDSKNCCTKICNTGEKICSKTLLVQVRHKSSNKIVKAYAIIDEQSSSSFVDPSLLPVLQIEGLPHSYSLRTLSGLESNVNGEIVEGLEVCGVLEQQWYELPKLLTNSFIPDSRQEVTTPKIVSQHAHLSQFRHNFPELNEEIPVLFLLGANSGEVMHTKCYGNRAPYAHKTPLGWAMVGSACLDDSSHPGIVKALKTSAVSKEYSFSAKAKIGAIKEPCFDVFKEHNDDESLDYSKDEKSFLRLMESQTKFENGKLIMPLPFRDPAATLPDNRLAVFYRTKAALDRMKKDGFVLNQCLKGMATNIEKGHIERVPQSELIPADKGKTWFLPIFNVLHKKKEKPRMVFDGSASFNGVSLNGSLLQGPHLTNDLRSVLLRFRKGQIGLTCDIEHMFYNFYVPENQKDYLRFYWFENNDPEMKLVQYRARVHLFGACSSPGVATFGLRYCAEKSSLKNAEKAKQFILESFYVDDGVTSVNNIEEGLELIQTTKKLLQEFGIRVHKFTSSSLDLLKALPKDELAVNPSQVDFDESSFHRTLGVVWNLLSDSFVVKAEIPDTEFTIRGVLSAVNSFFDPEGFAAPVTLAGRLIQRKALPRKEERTDPIQKFGYDDPLPSKLLPLWNKWKNSLRNAYLLRVPRCFVPMHFGVVSERTLHVYCDASLEAIGVVIYLRSVNREQSVYVSLVRATSRVSPRAATTVPRLELNAALQAAVSAQEVVRDCDIHLDSVSFYSDSQVVLGYLNNNSSNFTKYVTRRTESILKITDAEHWQYISTGENPADLASRPSDPLTLINSKWFSGPAALYSPKLPVKLQANYSSIELPETIDEEKILMTRHSYPKFESIFSDLYTRRGGWNFLVAVTQRILKFISLLLRKVKPLISYPTDITRASHLLLMHSQRESYPEVIDRLKKNRHLPEKHPLSNLSPFMDEEGLVRVGGRLKNSLPFDKAHPVLVPAAHPVSTCLIQHLHSQVGHQGRHITHGYIREMGYHLESGRQVIRKLLTDCVLCRKLRGRFEGQQLANLPQDRLETCPPFSNTGLDVFGPLYFHDGVNTRRSSASKKAYVLLLTCLVTRAVHTELLSTMDTSSFINALRRFLAIRGQCRRFRSDHGSNFVGALNQTSNTLDGKKIQQFVESRHCEWQMNPPGASHFGGCWERKIGSVRRVLEGTLLQLGKRTLSREELTTFLMEATSIVNSTPLYEVSSDPNDACPITPNTLLTLKDNAHPPPTESFTESDLLQYGTKRWRRVQYLAEQFWVRWRSLYLQHLTVRRKWKLPKNNIKVGDVVLLRVKNAARNQWPLASVVAVKTSTDNLVRSATVRIDNKTYERKIHDLVLLIARQETE